MSKRGIAPLPKNYPLPLVKGKGTKGIGLRKNNQGGFSLIESILVITIAVGLIFVVYHFGWGATGQAGAKTREADIRTLQIAVGAYILNSNGLYPTDDSKLPGNGEHKLIMWDASFGAGGKQLSFYPDFIKRLPKHWNEGVWWIDNAGKVSADVASKDY